jgi:pullulanase
VFIHVNHASLRIHFHRFDNDYEGWDIWAWPDGKQGEAFPFQSVGGFGASAAFTLHRMERSTKIGLLLRRKAGGADWAEREAEDRYIEELDQDGSTDLWIIQGDPRLYTKADIAFKNRRKRIVEANMASLHTVDVLCNALPDESGEWEQLQITAADGRIVPIHAPASVRGRTIRIETIEPLDVKSSYTITLPGFDSAEVSLAGMFGHPAFERHYTYRGSDLGVTCTTEGLSFRLWAPTASAASVVIYDAWDAREGSGTEHTMNRSIAGTWLLSLQGDWDGAFYTYKVCIEAEWREAVDPYAKALSANGRKGAIVHPDRTVPEGWEDDMRPSFHAATDAILYELHVRDATVHPSSGVNHPGTFLGLAERGTQCSDGYSTGLDYAASLGVTHIQLLPVSDFVSVDEADPEKRMYNWGYDPAHYFAPEGSYATDPLDPASRIRECKQMILALHQRGLRVVLDVVYNHMFSAERSCLHQLVPGYYFRSDERGRLANGTGVGNDTASERAMMRKLIVDCVSYWVKEYHVDGFRFDLMGIHDIDTMNEVRRRLDAEDESLLLYGEGWQLNTPLPDDIRATLANAKKLPRIGQFHDQFRDGMRGGVFDARERGFVGGSGARAHDVWTGIVGAIPYGRGIAGFAQEPHQTINYVEVHDNHTLWDRLQLSNRDDSDMVRRRMQRLAASILLTSQGIPLLHAGQEWFRTKHGEHNSYRSPDVVNWLDWDRASAHRHDIEYVKGLIHIRRSHEAFRIPTSAGIRERLHIIDTPPGVIAYTLHGRSDSSELPYEIFVVAHNALRDPVQVHLPVEAIWCVLCDGETAGTKPIRSFHATDLLVLPLTTVILGKA